MREEIEILPVSLLDQHRPVVNELRRLARSLGLDFGWHYLLDLTWMIARLGSIQGKTIMDAGAGIGVIQWYLANQGARVYSVDRGSRANLALRFRGRFRVRGLRREDLVPTSKMLRQSLRQNPPRSQRMRVRLRSQARDLASLVDVRRSPGQVIIYNQDLKSLPDLPDNSLDAVVAISALEHNEPQDLQIVVAELMRVLKPGGTLLATLGAARDQDWFHQASHGWCYTDASLRRLFDLPLDTPSNYAQYDELFADLLNCAELRDTLASFYFRSGDNCMPWGKWDPQYQSVGVCKIKK